MSEDQQNWPPGHAKNTSNPNSVPADATPPQLLEPNSQTTPSQPVAPIQSAAPGSPAVPDSHPNPTQQYNAQASQPTPSVSQPVLHSAPSTQVHQVPVQPAPNIQPNSAQPLTASQDSTTPPAAAKITPQHLLAELSKEIPAIERGAGYRFGVVLCVVVLISLPFLFLGAVVGCSIGLWYAIQSANFLGIILVGVPFVLSLFLCLCLIKPLFAPVGDYHPPIVLDPKHEPLLFAFVERLCRVVGAPIPARIEVDTDVNASASFRRGLFRVFFGRSLVLTVGLPLVAGLPLRQLTGIIAHELGHFTQGSGMKLSYIIRRVNAWFEVAAFGRDVWDYRLEQAALMEGGVGVVASIMKFFVTLSRYGLYFMRNFIHMIICRLMREMEFDADKYEMRVVGSDTFCHTSQNMYALAHGWEVAHEDLSQSWRDHRLSDDLPAMVVAKVDQMRSDPELASKIRTKIFEEKTEWFMTHPSTPERIQEAQRERAPGVFRVDAPASVLFQDFEGLCKMATLYYYQREIGPEVTPQNLVATKTIVDESRELDKALETLRRYFQGKILGAQEIFLPKEMLYVPKDPKQTVQLLRVSRQRMLDHLMETVKAVRRFEAADERVHDLHKAQIVLNAGFQFNPATLRLPSANHHAVASALGPAEQERHASRVSLQEAMRDSQNRLIAALQLLHVDQVASRLPAAEESQQRCKAMLTTLVVLESVWPTVSELMEVGSALNLLLDIVDSTEVDHQLFRQVTQVAGHAHSRITFIRTNLSTRVYPFTHARGRISIADYALKELPGAENVGDVLAAAAEILDNLNNLYFRVIAHLATIAESIETVFGFEPLPKPPDQTEQNWWQTDISV